LRRIVVPDIQANAPTRRLANQGVQQHFSDPPTANVRPYTNGDLGRALVDEECRFLTGCELPRPRSTYWPAVAFGNETKILGPLPSREMSSDVRRYSQEIPQTGQIVLCCRPVPNPGQCLR
jgi:hypothetical protein